MCIRDSFETVYFWPDLPQCFREVYRVLKPCGTLLICNESNGDTDKDKKWTEIIGGMTIYKDVELKAVSYTHLDVYKRQVEGGFSHLIHMTAAHLW